MRRNAQGFTLIELIVVITVLGILASIALPRFIGVQRDARISKLLALNGSIRAASSLAHARCLLDQAATPVGACLPTVASVVSMEGVNNIVTINSYPQAIAGGIIAAAQLDAATDGLTISGGGAGAAQLITVDLTGATAPATCRISYTSPAAAAGSAPVILPPLTAGC